MNKTKIIILSIHILPQYKNITTKLQYIMKETSSTFKWYVLAICTFKYDV